MKRALLHFAAFIGVTFACAMAAAQPLPSTSHPIYLHAGPLLPPAAKRWRACAAPNCIQEIASVGADPRTITLTNADGSHVVLHFDDKRWVVVSGVLTGSEGGP